MSTILSDLTTGTAPPPVTSTGASSTALPSDITNLEAGLTSAIGNQNIGYQPYQGQMVANANTNQTGAYNGVAGLSNGYYGGAAQAPSEYATMAPMAQGQLKLANNYGATGLNAAYNPNNSWAAQSQNYMSPYLQDVTSQIAAAGNQNFNTQLLPSINSQFIGSGDFNSLNNLNGAAEGAGLAQQGITSAQAQALNQGYTTGMQGYESTLGQQVGAANNAGSLANSGSYAAGYNLNNAGTGQVNLGNAQTGNLSNTGQTEYNIGQADLNANMGQYMNTYTMPIQQAQGYSSAAGSLPWPGTTSGTSTGPLAGAQYGPSPIAQAGTVAGGLSAAQNLYNNTFGSPSTSSGGSSGGYNFNFS